MLSIMTSPEQLSHPRKSIPLVACFTACNLYPYSIYSSFCLTQITGSVLPLYIMYTIIDTLAVLQTLHYLAFGQHIMQMDDSTRLRTPHYLLKLHAYVITGSQTIRQVLHVPPNNVNQAYRVRRKRLNA